MSKGLGKPNMITMKSDAAKSILCTLTITMHLSESSLASKTCSIGNMDAEIDHCRRIDKEYNRSISGSNRARPIYAHMIKSGKIYKTGY